MCETTVPLPRVGSVVKMCFRKFDASPHWEYELVTLGADDLGIWLAGWPDDICRRPGRTVVPGAHWVVLVPFVGNYVATFNAPGPQFSADVYVDLTDTPQWRCLAPHQWRLDCLDMDLDVVRDHGRCWIDDEDEFAEHRVRYGYPPEMVDSVRRTADQLWVQVRDRVEPFDQVGATWLARCIASTRKDLIQCASGAG
ncbi:hypothetical protein KEM60_02188 [Austwickia sp. TVS 96-490-7B]|uniref:DUF402 domain-containing protein n=1 Tax=Austwickia sp. TVS 96-490-7B TaxID=2830843 RepID=UPI001C598ABB|nr:DUF402 domain-containing protein [Austwickia sp. TVS 96-490-7B]MBW3085977.1 hypothetical protein [Austwickia sp. TVS 96-490-7B]